ncbi:hypothetical protein FZX13_01060 [Synechococcus sp. MU1625]|nr:hypothetical protein [Synechococcus sp. MU1650]MCB4398556.1 hypothetical protein [Synechococcus sp. MU1625]
MIEARGVSDRHGPFNGGRQQMDEAEHAREQELQQRVEELQKDVDQLEKSLEGGSESASS